MKSDDSTSTDDPFDGDGEGLDWREYYHALRKRLWIVLLCTVLGAIAAAVYMNGQQRTYQARSVLFFQQEQSHVLDKVEGVSPERIANLDMVNTVVDVLRGFPYAERVATRLRLQKDPRFLSVITDKPASEVTAADAAAYLVPHVVAAYRPKTRLIDIFVTHPNASMATDLANAYAEEYLRFGFDQRSEANKAATQSLLDESERLRKQLRVSEEAMQSFREQEKAVSLETSQESTQHKLEEYSKTLTDLENKIAQLDNDLKAASATPGDTDALLRLPSVAQQPKVSDINQAITETERQFTILKQRYRAKHPSYIAVQTQLDSLRHNRTQVLQDVVTLLRGERARLQAQYDGQKSASDAQETRLLADTGKTAQYNELKRDVETNRAMYNSVQGRITEIDVANAKGMTESQVQIHERALGAAPVMVSIPKVYSLGTVLGLLTGMGIALGLHFLDQSVKTVDQVEQLSGLPVLAAIPKKDRPNARTLDVIAEREGVVAESFRSLRTSLAMVARGQERRTFLFTSAVPSEGKTFCSSNFAASLAQQGFRTLLIDADLRRPMVSRIFFGEDRQPGLSDLLAAQGEYAADVQPTQVENLDVLPAGSRAPNPAELLADPKMLELIQDALASYQRIVIDSPPILAVSDSLLIAPHVDVTCLVLRSFKTPRKTFARALRSLAEIHRRPAGIVFNFVPSGARNHYYYSGKYHGVYGEKGVYGT